MVLSSFVRQSRGWRSVCVRVAPSLSGPLARWQSHRVSSRQTEEALIAEHVAPGRADPVSVSAGCARRYMPDPAGAQRA